MAKGIEEGKITDKKRITRKKKLLAILIAIIIIQVSVISIWYFYFRPWTIRDVAKATNVDFPEEYYGPLFLFEETRRNPGFSRDLAGKDKIVKGQVTNITSYDTTIGPLTYIELDDFEHIHLIEWDYPRYEVGD
ncbi:MAG: hypothetical protein JSV09_06130, partial [Thermoplasmata archaeon]